MVITHEMPLEDGPKGFRMFDDKSSKDQCVKVFIIIHMYVCVLSSAFQL